MTRTAMTAAPGRRTQEERRATTRAALLDATVASLVDVGYARTTTTEVCERAGVSQGALFRYFPTKHALLAAAAEHLYADLTAHYVLEFARLPGGRRQIAEAIRTLWSVFARPDLAAAYELQLAARTDEDLRRHLVPVVAQHATTIRRRAAELFPHMAATRQFGEMLDLVLELMQGMAVSRMIEPDDAHARRLVAVVTAVTQTTLGQRREHR